MAGFSTWPEQDTTEADSCQQLVRYSFCLFIPSCFVFFPRVATGLSSCFPQRGENSAAGKIMNDVICSCLFWKSSCSRHGSCSFVHPLLCDSRACAKDVKHWFLILAAFRKFPTVYGVARVRSRLHAHFVGRMQWHKTTAFERVTTLKVGNEQILSEPPTHVCIY